jgi:hypothetical protein
MSSGEIVYGNPRVIGVEPANTPSLYTLSSVFETTDVTIVHTPGGAGE